MSKFKRGDTVRRTGCAFLDVVEGGVYTINYTTDNGWFNLKDYPTGVFNTHPYNERHFELYQEHLTPAEILQCIVDGVPLELKAGDTWKMVVNPHGISAWNMLKSHYRKLVIPPTVLINGTEVPKPMSDSAIDGTVDRSIGYYIDITQGSVYTKRILRGQQVWAKREDAARALDAILTALKGE